MVLRLVSRTNMRTRTVFGLAQGSRQHVLIDVITVDVVKVTIVKVISVVVMPEACVPASLGMVVVVIGMHPVFHGARLSKEDPYVNRRANSPSSRI
jgi:hypothetical protein